MGSGEFSNDSKSGSRTNTCIAPLDGTGRTIAIRKRVHGEGGRKRLRPIRKVYSSPFRLGLIEVGCGYRERRKFSKPLLHGPMAGVVHGVHVSAAIFTVSGRENRSAPIDDEAEVDSSEVDLLYVNDLPGDGDLGLLGLKLPLIA